MEKKIKRFYNYLTVADKYTGDLKSIYFFIKKNAFQEIYDHISDPNFKESEKGKITDLYENYSKELEYAKNENIYKEVTKEELADFLETFYSKMDFNNLEMLLVSKDMLELLLTFGPMDDLTARRMEYFNNRISILDNKKNISENEGFNYNSIPQSIKEKMKNFNLPIDINNDSYQKYEANLISIIESANEDLEFGKYNDSLEKLESALYYLIQIKKR